MSVPVAGTFRILFPAERLQSKMSGQPIIERDGKFYIKEYESNGVKFDDYKNGILYEYKDIVTPILSKTARNFAVGSRGRSSSNTSLGPSGSRERYASDMEGWLGSGESFSEGTWKISLR